MKPDELDLLHGYLNGAIGDADFARLQTLLRESAEARLLLRNLSTIDAKLQELAAANPATLHLLAAPKSTPVRTGRPAWNPFLAAAAGLVFGLFSASLVWGYVGPFAGKVMTLMEEDFEVGNPPLVTGMPVSPGHWSGDFSEVVGEFHDVKPAHGRKMLRFVRADYEGKPVGDGYVADLFRVVDLRDARRVTEGEATLAIEARFAAQPHVSHQTLSCGVTIYALESLPPVGTRDHSILRRPGAGLADASELEGEPRILASAARSEKAPADGRTWRSVRSELRLPAETRYALLHLRAHLRGSERAEIPKPVKFAGLFLDDIRLTLIQRAARP